MRRLAPSLAAAVCWLLTGCGDDDPGEGGPAISAALDVVPFAAPLEGVRVQAANDSLDFARHDGRTFLAFRTSASYFPDESAEIHVVSAEGEVRWEHEITFETDDDVRDPRFLAWDGRLFLFFSRVAVDEPEPTPIGTMVSTLVPEEGWSEPVAVLDPGFVVSHVYVDEGLPYMTAWGPSGDALAVHFLTSTDGLEWTPMGPAGPAVEVGGGSETGVLFRGDGSLLAVTVNARGDELGWGSRLCTAPQLTAAWSCRGDPRRFDGAALFAQDGHEYMIARRNVTDSGAYDLGRDDLSAEEQTLAYREDYDAQPKRCALWEIGEGDAPVLVADLPSRGDTCAPSLLRQDDRHVATYYQSSPLDGPDVPLRVGQAGASKIHRVLLSF